MPPTRPYWGCIWLREAAFDPCVPEVKKQVELMTLHLLWEKAGHQPWAWPSPSITSSWIADEPRPLDAEMVCGMTSSLCFRKAGLQASLTSDLVTCHLLNLCSRSIQSRYIFILNYRNPIMFSISVSWRFGIWPQSQLSWGKCNLQAQDWTCLKRS